MNQKYLEPNNALADLYSTMFSRDAQIDESTDNQRDDDDEGDDGLDIPDSEFDTIMESIIGDYDNTDDDGESEDTGSDHGDDDGDDLSEFDSDGQEDADQEEELVQVPASMLQSFYEFLKSHFEEDGNDGEEDDGGEDIIPADDENSIPNDEIPTESAPIPGKKFIDSKKTGFQSNATIKPLVNMSVNGDKKPKSFKKTGKTIGGKNKKKIN